MKSPRKFLFFISMETRRRRHTVVIGYYSFFAVLMIFRILFRGGPDTYAHLLPLTFYASAILGGLTINGPVRPFSHWQRNIRDGSAYNSNPRKMQWITLFRGEPLRTERYDEHDIAMRDHAHYLAYAALRWITILFVLFGAVVIIDWPPPRVAQFLLFLSVPFCIVFFSLPQAIILWTEPDLDPDPEEQPPQTVIRVVP